MKLDISGENKLSTEHIKLLNEIAIDTRAEYNLVIESLAKGNESNLDWWVSDLASRNTYLNKFFLNLCYLNFISKIGQIETISEIALNSSQLKKVLKSYKDEKNLHFRIKDIRSTSDRILSILVPCKKFLYQLFVLLNRFFASKCIDTKLKELPSDLILIDLFVYPTTITNVKLKDRYYNNFGEFIPDSDKERIFYNATFHNVKDFFSVYKKIRSTTDKFLLKENYVRLIDWVSSFLYPLRALRFFKRRYNWKGYNIAPLINEVWVQNIYTQSFLEPLLQFKAIRRLKQKGISIRLAIDWFENQSIDKAFNLALNTYFPETRTVGYQIGSDHQFYLCYFPTKLELKSNVLPKEIFVTGNFFQELVKEFCPELRVSITSAFTYSHIWDNSEHEVNEDYYTILVPLPITMKDTDDIIDQLKEIQSSLVALLPKLRIWIKPHPPLSANQILERFGDECSPIFEFIEGDFDEFIARSDLLIGNNSSTCLESIAKGIPTIIIGSRTGLVQNPIPKNIDERIWKLTYGPEELISSIQSFYELREPCESTFRKIGLESRKDLFEPVTQDSFNRLWSNS